MRAIIAILALSLFYSDVFSQIVLPVGDDFFVVPVQTSRTPTFDFSSFDYQRKNENILTGFPIGHNLPKATNELFYNLNLDGYGGLPFGSCLYRKETLGQTIDGVTRIYTNEEQTYCTANENSDLMRVWANRNPNLKNVLIKNLTIQNAFRTRNVVDGTLVQRASELPHTDTFQSFYLGSSQEDPDWLVLQDTLIKNSDNSLMIHGGGRFKGAVYQNLVTACEAEFEADTRLRAVNDYKAYISTDPGDIANFEGGRHACTNAMNFSSSVAAPVWLIEVTGPAQVVVSNQDARVIVIGSEIDGESLTVMRRVDRQILMHQNVLYFASIEDALNAGYSRPPYIEMSCAGWRTPPRNCERRRGYLN